MEPEPKRKRERRPPEVRREQILDAAARVLVAKGASATQMSDVAAGAGVAKGTVYLYFESKEQLLSGLGARYTEELIRRSGELLEGDAPASLLDRFLEEVIDFHLARRELHHVLFHEGAVSEAEAMQQLRELMRRFIERGVEAGDFEVTDAGFTADFLLHLVPARELVRKALGAHSRVGKSNKPST